MNHIKLSRAVLTSLVLVTLLAGCDRRTPEERLGTAIEFYQQQDITSAEMEALKVIEKAPDDPAAIQAHQLLAQIYATSDRNEEALEQFEIALGKVSQKEEVGKQLLSSYVQLLASQKQYDKALQVVDKYQQENAKDEGTSLSLSMLGVQVRTQAGQTTAAREILQKQMDVTTNSAEMEIYSTLYFNTLERDENTTGAIAFMEEQLNKATEPVRKTSLKLTLANLYGAVENYEKSRGYLESVTAEFTQMLHKELDRRARLAMSLELAQAYQTLGNLPGARRVYQELYDVAGNDPQLVVPVAMGMVENLMRQGDTSATEAFLTDVVKNHPDAKMDTHLENFHKLAASGELAVRAPEDTSTLAMKYRQDPNILWPADLPALLKSGAAAGLSTGTASETSATQPAEVQSATTAPATAP